MTVIEDKKCRDCGSLTFIWIDTKERGERLCCSACGAVHDVVSRNLLAALEAYMNAGIGNSTDFALQIEAYRKSLAAIATARGEK